MSTGRLLTLLRHLPREGAFFACALTAPEPVKRRASVAEMASLFGFKLPAKKEVTSDGR